MVIDGRKIAVEILSQVKRDVALLSFKPKLVDVVVGSNPVVDQYVGIKKRRAAQAGIAFGELRFAADVGEAELVAAVHSACAEENVCGVIIQLPLPAHLNKANVVGAIDPRLDVDVIGNQGARSAQLNGHVALVPPTAGAVLRMLEAVGVEVAGKHAVVVGAGELVGKPTAALLRARGARVSVADSSTKNLSDLCQTADILVSAAGVPSLVTASMVSAHAVVVDAGTSDTVVGISGDVDFASVAPKVAAISPVPGGVGPVAVAMLLANVAKVAASV